MALNPKKATWYTTSNTTAFLNSKEWKTRIFKFKSSV